MPHNFEAEKAALGAILEVCREVKLLFSEEGAAESPVGSAPELARYRKNLEAGLAQLQGQWKETLGENRD